MITTSKEKAEELVHEFTTYEYSLVRSMIVSDDYTAKKHADSCVDRIIAALCESGVADRAVIDYWKEVKQEIQNL